MRASAKRRPFCDNFCVLLQPFFSALCQNKVHLLPLGNVFLPLFVSAVSAGCKSGKRAPAASKAKLSLSGVSNPRALLRAKRRTHPSLSLSLTFAAKI